MYLDDLNLKAVKDQLYTGSRDTDAHDPSAQSVKTNIHDPDPHNE